MTDVKPFRNRIRVVAELIDDMDEINLVTAIFQSMGWVVRPARRTTGLIRVPMNTSEADVSAELVRYNLRHSFDPSRNSLRPAVPALSERSPDAAVPEPPPLRVRLSAATGLILSLLFGVVTVWVPNAWKAVPLAFGIVMAVPIAHPWRGAQTLLRRLSFGLTVAATFTFAGIIFESQLSDRRPVTFFGFVAVALPAAGAPAHC